LPADFADQKAKYIIYLRLSAQSAGNILRDVFTEPFTIQNIIMKQTIMICLVTSCLSYGYSQKTDDTAAIKNLLEKESATWRSGDIKAHADCWQIQPYSRILVSTPEGNTYDVSPALMINPSPNSAGKGGSSVNTNYKMSIHGDNAWVSHNEESTTKDGTKKYSYEIRLLEKISGQWKLVGQSIHVYKPK
jgi:hypothetical protein